MTEINSVSLGKLHKEQHLGYMTNTNELISKNETVKTGLGSLYAPFLETVVVEAAAVKQEQGSLITGKMDILDKERESLSEGFNHLIGSGLKHFNAQKREAATELKHVVDKYGNFSRKPNADETVDMRAMCTELLSEQHVTALGKLDDGVEWITRILAVNEGYNTHYLARNAEDNDEKVITSKQARSQTDPCYQAIVRRVNALAELNGEEAYISFINQLNGLIADLKTTMSVQATARKKAADKENSASETDK